MEELSKMISTLRRTFKKGAWHGPSVKEVLQDITPEMAQARLPQTHSIIELVSHMTSWRNFAVKRLQGDAEFTVTDEMNFPAPADWHTVTGDLEKTQEE